MYSIGIDQSLTNTGVVIIKEGKAILCDNVKSGPEGKHMNERIHRINDIYVRIRKILAPIILDGKQEEVILSIEGYSFASRSGQAFSLGELGGILRYNFFMDIGAKLGEKMRYLEITPNQLKKYATGKGQCEKDLIIKEVYKNFAFDTNDNNTADAFVLAHIGYTKWNHFMDTPIPLLKKHQQEVIDKLDLI